jgi:hypothetical protein
MEKLRGDFKKDPLNFELLYTIIKLSNPVLRSNKNEKKILINEILEIMKNRKLFFYFITFCSINDDILKKLIPSLKYDYCNKDHYIYKENDISEKFYF